MSQSQIIPIMTCFNNAYVIPAAVCFYSMLENTSKDYFYKLYVLHSDISEENQKQLQNTIREFSNASLEFIDMQNKFSDLFEDTTTKGHYSKEIFYKFIAASVFPQYDKIIITDVDVVWLGDISKVWENFVEDELYLGGIQVLWKNDQALGKALYSKDWTEEERKRLSLAGGLLIFNLKLMRKDNLVEKFVQFASSNKHRLLQPEQDVINFCCYPMIKRMPPNFMVCSYAYDFYQSENEYGKDITYSAEEVKYALENPIQLHFATHIKPWNTPNCTKSEVWYSYLCKTPFFKEFMPSKYTSPCSSWSTKKLRLFSYKKRLRLSLLLEKLN